jgi:hypothetical protein
MKGERAFKNVISGTTFPHTGLYTETFQMNPMSCPYPIKGPFFLDHWNRSSLMEHLFKVYLNKHAPVEAA